MKEIGRFISGLLAICMLLSMLPIQVFADGDEIELQTTENPAGVCGEDLTWEFIKESGTLTIRGTGEMDNWWTYYEDPVEEHSFTPWHFYLDQIHTVVLEEGVTGIGICAFYDCRNLKEISLPSTLVSISDYAFAECHRLESLRLPQNLVNIGNSAFENCFINLTEVTIPESVEKIGESAFYQCNGLSKITLPQGLTEIADYTFAACYALTDVNIPDSISSIGEGAFADCVSLTDITLPEGIEEVAAGSFTNCYELACISIPESVVSIESGAFAFTALTSITIPENVKWIDGSFAATTSLEEIIFTGNAPDFHEMAFNSVTATAWYPVDDTTWTSDVMQDYGGTITWEPYGDTIEDAVEGTCGENLIWEFDTKSGTLTISGTGNMDNTWWPYDTPSDDPNFAPWHDHAAGIKTVVIDSGVTGIGHFAFFDCINLTSVSIPESVTFVGCAFVGCDSLKELHIPASVTDFRYPTNEGICTGIARIVVDADNAVYSSDEAGMLYNKDKTKFIGCPTGYQGACRIADSVTEIGSWAFAECTGLTSVALPAALKNIGMSAFLGCNGLTDLDFPENVATIEATAFAECTGLISIVLPASVANLRQAAFSNCAALSEVRFEGNAPDIYNDCFYGTTLTAYYPVNNETWTEDKQEDYGGTITWVPYGEDNGSGDSEFEEVNETVYAVSLANVRSGPETHCEKLGTLNIGDSVTRIGISESGWSKVLYNGQEGYVKSDYLSLTKLHTHNYSAEVTAPTCTEQGYTTHTCNCGDSYVSDYVKPTGHIFGMWYETKAATQDAEGEERRDCTSCNDYETHVIDKLPFGNSCGENLTWTLDEDGTLTISGSGEMYDYDDNKSPWFSESQIQKVIIENGVSSIGTAAFMNCKNLREVSIPGSIIGIGKKSFYNCSNLTELIIPEGVTKIGDWALLGCSGLVNLTIPNSVTEIGNSVLSDCSSLVSITLPENFNGITSNMFRDCSKLSAIKIPDSAQYIGDRAFQGCSSLSSITIPDSINILCGVIFAECNNLKRVIFEGDAPEFAENTFEGFSATIY